MTLRILFLLLVVSGAVDLLASDPPRLLSQAAPASSLASVAPRAPGDVNPPPANDPAVPINEHEAWIEEWKRSWSVEGLPPDAPREGTLITVDTSKNVVYLFRDGAFIAKAPAATGMDKMLEHGARKWLFRTPRGIHRVLRKVESPVWRKPDWAYVEEGKKIPPPDHPSRLVKGKLGKYALDLGEGIMIHGTREKNSLGKKASHGCIRVGDEMLEHVWRASSVGTPVYIF